MERFVVDLISGLIMKNKGIRISCLKEERMHIE
jgi:hypothetical protein